MAHETPARLTPKGRATRERIIAAAAEIVHSDGTAGATNPAVRAAAGVSGSQLAHYFSEKKELVRAVVQWRADQVLDVGRMLPPGELDSLARLRAWADWHARRDDIWQGGCRFGSLANEILKTSPELAADVADGFTRWLDLFRRGLVAMRDRGELRQDADPERLAITLVAAFQGGMLLAQAARDVRPLAVALDEALRHIESYAENTGNTESAGGAPNDSPRTGQGS